MSGRLNWVNQINDPAYRRIDPYRSIGQAPPVLQITSNKFADVHIAFAQHNWEFAAPIQPNNFMETNILFQAEDWQFASGG